MKIHVAHDDEGRIRALVVPGPEFSESMTLLPGEGETVSVIEAPDLADEELLLHLQSVQKGFRVDSDSGGPMLVALQ
ncbi:hypothetical protein ACFVSN_30130 [Kitasatospora sp. NPDC057904]|uniref:hypothetical protein n=1 Tax=Kitasatospora sp. NPDC057904 TaxID=3346275 RepID=UPI0036DC594C